MDFVGEINEKGVLEQRFDLKVGSEVVPGILWRPADRLEGVPTVLIGHGGTQHKRVPNVVGLARRFVRHLGFAAVAIDAPGHGDRVKDPDAAERMRGRLERQIAAGPTGRPFEIPPEEAKAWVERTKRGVAEWKALVDELPSVGLSGPYGYWGVSMGTAIGLPFVASEPRISAAVLGLAGLGNRPGRQAFEAAARSLRVPILFIFQWDDELMNRESGTALFDAIGSNEKTMHINPGGHVSTPLFERDDYDLFFKRHLAG